MLKAKLTDQRGQSLIELALMAPFLLIALYIPVDFGVAMFKAHMAQNAAREATRLAVSTKDPFNSTAATSTASDALIRLPGGLTAKSATASFYGTGVTGCMQVVEVSVQGTYHFFLYQLMNLFGGTTPDVLTITRKSRMRYEFQPAANVTPACDFTLSGTAP